MNYEAAHKEYRQSLQLKPSVDAYLAIARLYRTQNQVPSALQAIDEALKLEPGNPAAAGLKSEIERPTPRQRRGRQ
jgi:tetratricopeptide (TPR) repeat protein